MNFQAYTLANEPQWSCIHLRAPDNEARTPIHLCCVIDTSGSMETEYKLDSVKNSLHFLLDFLKPEDSISIITFSDVARTVLKQTFVTAVEKENIRAQISLIHSETNTNLSAGIIEARESLHVDTSNVKQGILLLTDGIANMGLTRAQDILEIVSNTCQKFPGTSISCVGYGTDHNVDLLQQISASGGGSYYVVNNLEDVAVVFGDVLGGLVSCFAQQVRVILPAGTEVKTRYAVTTVGDKMEILVGDVVAGAEAVVLANMPTGATVGMRGYNLQSHSALEFNATIQLTADETLQTNGQAHYLRFEVLNILDKVRQLISTARWAEIPTHIQMIDDCVQKITTYRATHEHNLWDILLTELNTMRNTIANRSHIGHNTAQIMTQHGAYLGMMRGIAATQSAGAEEEVIQSPPGLSRAFSNTAQRHISEQLHTTVTPIAIRQRAYDIYGSQDPRNFVSPSATPITVSPQLGGLVGIMPMNSLSLGRHQSVNPTNSFPSPPATSGLTRQIAAPSGSTDDIL